MADERLYIGCQGCGEKVLLSKFYGTECFLWNVPERNGENSVEEFMEDHWLRCLYAGGNLEGHKFELVSEHGEAAPEMHG